MLTEKSARFDQKPACLGKFMVSFLGKSNEK